MQIGIIKEHADPRVCIVPDTVKRLVEEGHQVFTEEGAGDGAFITDEKYRQAGAEVLPRTQVLEKAHLICTIIPPEEAYIPSGDKVFISQFEPYAQPERVQKLQDAGHAAFSLDMIPRISMAQTMDVLSSMASIAGYKAVIMAALHLPKYFPMLTTAAGSIPPARVLVLGAGVAGLQAIATARRLGAVVEAFDTRVAVKEEVESLGAKFVMVEGAKDDKDAGGYAVEQSEDYKRKQGELIREKSEKSDVIITTAQLRGKPAPILIPADTVKAMSPGSVIVDLASSTGGNCELSEDNAIVEKHGVIIIGDSNLSAKAPVHASALYSKNVYNYLKTFNKEGAFHFDPENPVAGPSCLVYQGKAYYQVPQPTAKP